MLLWGMARKYLDLDAATDLRITAEAKRLGRTRNSLIRAAVRTYLELLDHQPDPPIRLKVMQAHASEKDLIIV